MAKYCEALEDAKFYKQALVKVETFATIQFYATSYPQKTVYIPEGFAGSVELLEDFREKI